MTSADRPSRTRVELLYFDGCPTYLEAEQTLREVQRTKPTLVDAQIQTLIYHFCIPGQCQIQVACPSPAQRDAHRSLQRGKVLHEAHLGLALGRSQ